MNIEAAKKDTAKNDLEEVHDKGLIDGSGTYQGRNTGLLSKSEKKAANEHKARREKNKKVLASAKDILNELSEIDSDSSVVKTPKRPKRNARKSAAARKISVPPKDQKEVRTPTHKGKLIF